MFRILETPFLRKRHKSINYGKENAGTPCLSSKKKGSDHIFDFTIVFCIPRNPLPEKSKLQNEFIVLRRTWAIETITGYWAIWRDTEYSYCRLLYDWIALHYYKGKDYTFPKLFIVPTHRRENSNSDCLILDATEAWLLLKLPLKISTVLSNQIITHFAQWLAGFKGGFKFTKLLFNFAHPSRGSHSEK